MVCECVCVFRCFPAAASAHAASAVLLWQLFCRFCCLCCWDGAACLEWQDWVIGRCRIRCSFRWPNLYWREQAECQASYRKNPPTPLGIRCRMLSTSGYEWGTAWVLAKDRWGISDRFRVIPPYPSTAGLCDTLTVEKSSQKWQKRHPLHSRRNPIPGGPGLGSRPGPRIPASSLPVPFVFSKIFWCFWRFSKIF